MGIQCQACSKKISRGAEYCGNCGSKTTSLENIKPSRRSAQPRSKAKLVAGLALGIVVALLMTYSLVNFLIKSEIGTDEISLQLLAPSAQPLAGDTVSYKISAHVKGHKDEAIFLRFETSSDGLHWTEKNIAEFRGQFSGTEKVTFDKQPVFTRLGAYLHGHDSKPIKSTQQLKTAPIDVEIEISKFLEKENQAWARARFDTKSVEAGISFWADNAYPGLYDTTSYYWTSRTGEYGSQWAQGYWQHDDLVPNTIKEDPNYVPEQTMCMNNVSSPLPGRTFKATIRTTYGSPAGIDENSPLFWDLDFTLLNGRFYMYPLMMCQSEY